MPNAGKGADGLTFKERKSIKLIIEKSKDPKVGSPKIEAYREAYSVPRKSAEKHAYAHFSRPHIQSRITQAIAAQGLTANHVGAGLKDVFDSNHSESTIKCEECGHEQKGPRDWRAVVGVSRLVLDAQKIDLLANQAAQTTENTEDFTSADLLHAALERIAQEAKDVPTETWRLIRRLTEIAPKDAESTT